MKKLIPIFLAMMLALTACVEVDEEEQKGLDAALPAGCVAKYLTEGYGEISRVLIVICDGRVTTSTSWMKRAGKTAVAVASVVIQ